MRSDKVTPSNLKEEALWLVSQEEVSLTQVAQDLGINTQGVHLGASKTWLGSYHPRYVWKNATRLKI